MSASAAALVTTPFGFESTAAEVVDGLDLTGRRIVVTGGSSGLGVETARALHGAGAEVTLAVRSVDAGKQAAAEIAGATGRPAPDVAPLDLADRASIGAFVAAWDGPLHVLVDNAGIMALPERRLTGEGLELQFATNHLGHFALATGLHEALASEGGRVVSVSSRAHLQSPVIFDDLHFAYRPYDPWLAYGQSKTANVLFAVEANARWERDGIAVNALHPGGILTNLQRHLGPDFAERAARQIRLKTPQQGAATSTLLAVSPHVEGVGGRYFEDGNEAVVVDHRPTGPDAHGVAPYALDRDNAARLWELSERLLRSPAG